MKKAKNPKNNWRKFVSLGIVIFLLFAMFFVDMQSFRSKCGFLNTFKSNIKWLANIIENYLCVFIAFIVIVIIVKMVFNLTFTVSGANIAGIDISLKSPEKLVKNNIKNFLSTKRSLFEISEEYDNYCEVFDSYHSIYTFLREQLLEFENKNKVDSDIYKETKEMINELNLFLTKNQSHFRRWVNWYEGHNNGNYLPLSDMQKKYPKYSELMADFNDLNLKMQSHAAKLGIDRIRL